MATVDRAYKNWPKYDDDLVNKAYVDSSIQTGGDIEGLKEQVDANTKAIGVANTNITNLNLNKLDSDTYNTFVNEQYNPLVLKVDGKIESFYQDTDPSVSWLTTVEKESHIGDIWYDTTTQKTLVYYKDETSSPVKYNWQWQNVPIDLLNTVNGKATIYSGIIPNNYKVGDYWIIPLDCYSNTSNIVSQSGEYVVGMKLTLGQYELEVLTVDSDANILTYTLNIPETSNYDISEQVTDDNIVVQITSTSSFDLPTDCYGGSICIATSSGNSYNKNDWIKRNNYVPSDKVETFATKESVKTDLLLINTTVEKTTKDLNDSFSLQIQTTTEKIYGDLEDTNGKLDDLDDYSKDKIETLEKSDSDLDDKYDKKYEYLLNQINILSDRITAYIQSTGGNNLIRNSVGFRGNRYWDLVGSNTEQSYRTYAGKRVTINFRYKKSGASTAKITLGYYSGSTFNTVYTIYDSISEVSDWSELDFSYVTSVNNPVIRFNSTFTSLQDNDAEANGASGSKLVFANGLEITDLMIGYGEKQPWTPYFDEVYGKTYNIDKYGFGMEDSASSQNMHLDTNSLDFKNKNGDVESVFSKLETKTDNIYANNTINIGNLNIIKIDDNNILEY